MAVSGMTPTQLPEMELAHVLFMDIVGYSKLPIEQQVCIMSELEGAVSITAGYRTANTQRSLISMHTGDGMALAFFSGPEAPVHCAVEIAKELKHHPRIKLRMGINSGPVYRIPDIKGEPNVAGGGVNFAQRVMDCGDEGHILLSASIADVLRQHGRWAPMIHELGVAEVKHGEHISISNLCTEEVGNPAVPEKMLAKPVTAGTSTPTPSTGSRLAETPSAQGPPWQPYSDSNRNRTPSASSSAATVGLPPEPPGKRLGDYEIVRELGHGGMGQVYLARNVISDRLEAMKILLPDLAQQGELANRFMREIKVLASLEHPNIAQLRTAFTAENQLVMIMEYVEGETLAHGLQRAAFTVPDAVNYIEQALSALSYAHGKGIIHRDIKPANMMLTPQGVVKLMDFGIARSTTDVGMTVTGTTMGSLDYMSPEQVKAEPMDSRSDLYSVGVSLYQMVTGQRMFAVTSSYSVMEAHVKEIPRPPIEVQPTLPKGLSDIIVMAVAKDPAQRFQTAEAFRNALSQVSMTSVAAAAVAQPQPLPVSSTPPPSPRPASVTPPPATPAPRPGAYATPLTQPARSGRHVGWLLAAAIVVLVAIFGGTQVYRSQKSNAALGTAAPTSMTQPAPSNAAPQPVQPPAAPAAASGAAPASPAPAPRFPKARSNDQGGNSPPQAGPPPGPSPEEIAAQKKLLDDLENETDHLESRAAAVESGVGALEQQMQQSGLGLRGDVVTARSNMRNDLAKAKQALEGADTDRARKYLDQASHEVEKLEAFLGRR